MPWSCFLPPRDPELQAMEAAATKTSFPIIGPAAGYFCYLVTRLSGARSVFELGSGFGYSTAWFARGVKENGGGVVHHTVWDAEHTVIRPIGGAVIAVATLGDASPAVKGMEALLGGTLATGTHLTKAGTRAAANTSPEPFSNWALSLAEDVFVIGLSALALKYPIAAALVVILGVIVILSFAAWIVRAISSGAGSGGGAI